MAGITAEDWTPIMIWLEHLFQDKPPGHQSLAARKDRFTDKGCSLDVIREFAYLKGCYAKGDWSWGGSRTGPVTLWPGYCEALREQDRWVEKHWSDGDT